MLTVVKIGFSIRGGFLFSAQGNLCGAWFVSCNIQIIDNGFTWVILPTVTRTFSIVASIQKRTPRFGSCLRNQYSESINIKIVKSIKKNQRPFLYFVDRASRYNSLLMTNLTHFFIYLFITPLYMFRASQCSSSGDRIVLIHLLV